MSSDKEYTRRCNDCGEAKPDQWCVDEPTRILRAITSMTSKGRIYDTKDLEQRELGVFGVNTSYECMCGASFTPSEWEKLEVVELE